MLEVLVLDYGAGNLASVVKALRAVGAAPTIAEGADVISRAKAIVIPGVGHFARTAAIDQRARDALLASITRDVPVLGVCLGMQWLFEGSDEAPDAAGLGLFPGRCFRLRSHDAQDRLKVPHVGWNTLASVRESSLLDGIAPASFAYFTHTYAAPVVGESIATTTHGDTFSAAVERGRVFGAQFHPEKSGDAGLRLLANFVRQAQAR